MYKVSDGDTITHTAATGGVTNGALITEGDLIGVAMNSVTGGADVTLSLRGEFAGLVKDAGANTGWAKGGQVHFMVTGGVNKLTGVAAAGKLVGHGVAAAATGDVTASVVLKGGPLITETQT